MFITPLADSIKSFVLTRHHGNRLLAICFGDSGSEGITTWTLDCHLTPTDDSLKISTSGSSSSLPFTSLKIALCFSVVNYFFEKILFFFLQAIQNRFNIFYVGNCILVIEYSFKNIFIYFYFVFLLFSPKTFSFL